MTPFKSILAATDFSVPANNAVRRAALLAKQHGARLGIVHVVGQARRWPISGWFPSTIDLDRWIANARSALHRLASDLTIRYDVTTDLEVRTGDVLQELHHASARADLLVMGQRRRSALAELVFGSTAQRLVECSARFVLVVKQAANQEYRRALVPIDFTPASDAAATVASRLAKDIDLQVFHAFDSTGEFVMGEADSESTAREHGLREEVALLARMRRSMARLGLDSSRLSFAFGRGSTVKATLRQAQSLNADVLVAAKQRRGRMATSMLGNVNSLLARSRCDVLIVSRGVRNPRHPQAVAAPRPAAVTGIGRVRASQAPVAQASSWMRSQRPQAFTAGPPGRPHRARG